MKTLGELLREKLGIPKDRIIPHPMYAYGHFPVNRKFNRDFGSIHNVFFKVHREYRPSKWAECEIGDWALMHSMGGEMGFTYNNG